MDTLFESFASSKPDGMGIGLSISRTIVEAHEGKLSAANRKGGGACFCVALPLAGPGVGLIGIRKGWSEGGGGLAFYRLHRDDLDCIGLTGKIRIVPRPGADQRPGERRREGDPAGGRIGFVVADDVDDPLAPILAEGDPAAEGDLVCGRWRRELGGGEASVPVAQFALQLGKPALVRLAGHRILQCGDLRLGPFQPGGG